MPLTVELSDAREWSDEQLAPLYADAFPAFISADHDVKKYIGRVREWFANLDIILVDERGEPRATGWGVPLRWSGHVDDLPSGFTDSLRRSVTEHEAAVAPNTFVIGGGIVHPEDRGGSTAKQLIEALKAVAKRHNLGNVIAPVRPTLKHAYPLISIDDYVLWTRDDGLPFDPWVRLHCRLGARIIATAPHSQTMTGLVGEWEQWTSMSFPQSGDYVSPECLSVVSINVENDVGTYVEPNIWVQHSN
jgi:GNAT superfamily N-acetyltransferase